MKIKLFNGSTKVLDLKLTAGGFDQETGRLTFIVSGEDGQAGTVTLSTPDTEVIKHAIGQAPKATRVDTVAGEEA